jgi:hypothetical protein
MRRLTSVLIGIGAALAVAQAAGAQLTVVPITVTSQTLWVRGFGMTTGPVNGSGSVGTSWNFGDEYGSSAGSVTSELVAGELVFTVDGTLSTSAATGGWGASFTLSLEHLSLSFVVPNSGTPLFLQLTKVNSEFTGPVESNGIQLFPFSTNFLGEYSSQILGLSTLGYVYVEVIELDTSASIPLNDLIPNDTILMSWDFHRNLDLNVTSSTGTFSETYTIRVVTPLPEPTSSLTIPSGAAMLIALAKLRGVGLGR